MRHALLIVTLIEFEVVAALLESLTDADDAAVAEDAEYTVDKLGLCAVEADILIVKKFDKSRRHCEIHILSPYYFLGGQIAFSLSGSVTQRCSGTKVGVI